MQQPTAEDFGGPYGSAAIPSQPLRAGARLRRLAAGVLSLALGACAAAPPPPVAAPAAPAPLPSTAPPPDVAAPAPAPPPHADVLVAAHREKAQSLERAGRLRQALDEWKIALTIKPGDAAAREGKKGLEERIGRGVADRVRQGRDALGRGDYLEARRHFLAALALDPANRVAFDALQNEVKELRFITHAVHRGETLATIAERYYGDRSRAEVIWEVNQLSPSPRLAAGTVLKIPEIPGVPFVHEARATPPPDATPRPDAAPPAEALQEETVEINPLLVGVREALEKGEYSVALADVDKVLAGHPQNAEGLDLKKAILYGLGRSQFNQRRYGDSYQTLSQLAALAPRYQDSPTLLGQARDRLVQQHYSQALRLFQEEKLEEAIAQWRTVLEFDPEHANAKKNLEQAERLLRSLRERQQPKKQ